MFGCPMCRAELPFRRRRFGGAGKISCALAQGAEIRNPHAPERAVFLKPVSRRDVVKREPSDGWRERPSSRARSTIRGPPSSSTAEVVEQDEAEGEALEQRRPARKVASPPSVPKTTTTALRPQTSASMLALAA